MADEFEIVTIAERSDLLDVVDELTSASWPEFMLHDAVANENWHKLYQFFPEFQFALIEPRSDQVVAVGISLPLGWDKDVCELPDEGWDWAMNTGFADSSPGGASRILCAISITVSAAYLGKGFSPRMVQAMKRIGRNHGFNSMIAPVRPNMKSQYPLTSMDRYVNWQNEDGLPFDAWMRVHARLGAEVVKICPKSMRITGSIGDWERWARMRFPDDGEYVVPGALVPVSINHTLDQGEYIEPNVWMRHAIHGK